MRRIPPFVCFVCSPRLHVSFRCRVRNLGFAESVDFTTLPTHISKAHHGCEVVSRTAALGAILWIICELEAAGHFEARSSGQINALRTTTRRLAVERGCYRCFPGGGS